MQQELMLNDLQTMASAPQLKADENAANSLHT